MEVKTCSVFFYVLSLISCMLFFFRFLLAITMEVTCRKDDPRDTLFVAIVLLRSSLRCKRQCIRSTTLRCETLVSTSRAASPSWLCPGRHGGCWYGYGYVFVYRGICVCVYVYVCMCVCEYVHLYMCTRVEPVLTLRPFHWLTLNRSLLHWSLLTNQYFRVTTRSFIIRYADMYALGLVSLSFMILHVCIHIYICA